MKKRETETRKHSRERKPTLSMQEKAKFRDTHNPEDEPAVERGERIATGKAIARAGSSSGEVPGAMPTSECETRTSNPVNRN